MLLSKKKKSRRTKKEKKQEHKDTEKGPWDNLVLEKPTAMSLGYAEKLSYIEDVGNVGMAEFFDSPQILQEKVRRFSFVLVHFDAWVGFSFF